MNEHEKYIEELEKELENNLKSKKYSIYVDSDNRVEKEVHIRERKIIKAPIPIFNMKEEKKESSFPLILLVSAVLACAIYYKTDGFNSNLPFSYNEIEDNINENGTGNINDRVYLSDDMKIVTIYYENESGEKCKKDYEFSEDAQDIYKQIINNNEFYSKNAQAGVICALMTLNKGIKYQYDSGKCGMDISKTYDCSHYIDEVSYLATGDNLGFGSTATLLTKGNEISEDSCKPGDIKLKRKDAHGKLNHVVMPIGELDDGKKYIIDCSSGNGVTVRLDNNYPICIRLNRFNTNEIENHIKDREGR